MNGVVIALASLGGIVTVTSIVVAILLYARGSYAKQKIEELRDDRDDAITRADAWQREAEQKDSALTRCAREAEHLRRENDLFRNAPTVAVQEISALLTKHTTAILEAVQNGRDKT